MLKERDLLELVRDMKQGRAELTSWLLLPDTIEAHASRLIPYENTNLAIIPYCMLPQDWDVYGIINQGKAHVIAQVEIADLLPAAFDDKDVWVYRIWFEEIRPDYPIDRPTIASLFVGVKDEL